MYGTNGGAPVIYGRVADGTYIKPGNAEERTSMTRAPIADQEALQKLFRSHSYLRNHKEFIRIDKVAGLLVNVLRAENKSEGYSSERSHSPKVRLYEVQNQSQLPSSPWVTLC
jgi:hypothetical protein